jgi:hypothetical protein
LDFKPAVCYPEADIKSARADPYNGWQFPATFICENPKKDKNKIAFHASKGDEITIIMVAVIVGLFILLGIGYVICHCYSNYFYPQRS